MGLQESKIQFEAFGFRVLKCRVRVEGSRG